MNPKLLIPILIAVLAASPLCAGEPGHACCAADSSTVASAPISDRSIYQLDATWTNDAGESVDLAMLRGRPVVLAMFFASCEYACPLIVSDMERIRDALPATVRAQTQFVLVSFDSKRDLPAALKAYRARMQLPTANWTLLHGAPDEVQELAMLLGVKYRQDARGQYSHSNLITVLNLKGEIVHQRAGLQGEVASAVRAVALASR